MILTKQEFVNLVLSMPDDVRYRVVEKKMQKPKVTHYFLEINSEVYTQTIDSQEV